MDAVLASLNPAQRAAVISDAAVLQVLAPPGSGKTKTLTSRVAHLISSGLRPWNIIVCTFTVKAAREMQARIKDLVEDSGKIKIGTFHGIALRYLRQYRQLAGLAQSFGIADTSDSTAIIRRIMKQHDTSVDAGATRSRISSLKAKGIDCDTFAGREGKKSNQATFSRIFQQYQAELKRSGLLDYDDILLRCIDLLRAHPECVDNIEHVLVDEFQDTNSVQYDLMALFAQKQQNITIVGDPDQSIYGWRSAEIKNLYLMKQRWSDTVTINLQENYRSAGSILIAAQAVIEQDTSRPQKALQATLKHGHQPVLRRLPTVRDEASWLVDEIKRLQGLTGGLLAHGDFAVLLRTASLSRVIESAFGSSGIPYRMVGGTKFYDRVEVKLVLDYLRVVDNPAHNEALARTLNVPPRRVGDKTLESLQREAQGQNTDTWTLVQGIARGKAHTGVSISSAAMKGIEQYANVILSCRKRLKENGCTITDVVHLIVQKTGLQAYLRGKYPEEYEARWASIEELLVQAEEVQTAPQDASSQDLSEDDTTHGLSHFLENAALSAAVDVAAEAQDTSKVTISTMHAAKGLEWPIVFVPACYNGSLPHSRSEDHDEERRLLYVAMTRAQAILYLSCPVKDSQFQETALSTFIDQPGCVKMFSQHGPTIGLSDVQTLSSILRRAMPEQSAIRAGTSTLHRDLDNYWPTDGTAPLAENKYQTAKAVPEGSAGFASARSRYDDLERQAKEAEKQAISKLSTQPNPFPRDEKRGKISSFFSTKAVTSTINHTTTMLHLTTSSNPRRPLTDMTNKTGSLVPSTSWQETVIAHALRSEPLLKRRKTDSTTDHEAIPQKRYAMFSSSPTKPDDDAASSIVQPVKPVSDFKPASTTHTTSLQQTSTGPRALGTNRGVGWSQRVHKPFKRPGLASKSTRESG